MQPLSLDTIFGLPTVADVGGGHGSTLAAILQVNRALRGILFGQPQVVAGAEPLLQAAGVAEVCEVVVGRGV